MRNILNRLREAAALRLVRPLDKGVTRMQAAPQLPLQVVPLFCNTLDLGPYLSLYISKNILIGEKWVKGLTWSPVPGFGCLGNVC
jgi:hypothetical protein